MRLKSLLLVLVLLCVLPISVTAAQRVGAQTLIENGAAYDGKTVLFEGEAVGDVLPRGQYAWLCLSDGSNSAMGVYASQKDAEKVKNLGSYQQTGDTVLVQGVFHRACARHGGDMDLHADTAEITATGYRVSHPVSGILAICAGLAFAIAAVLVCLVFHKWKPGHQKAQS